MATMKSKRALITRVASAKLLPKMDQTIEKMIVPLIVLTEKISWMKSKISLMMHWTSRLTLQS